MMNCLCKCPKPSNVIFINALICAVDIFTVPSSLAGLPALSLPAGLSNNNRPLGLQLIANTFREDVLLRGAYALEQEINFNSEPL